MKYNWDSIVEVEKSTGMLSLFNIHRKKQYLYKRIMEEPDVLEFLAVKTAGGKEVKIPFISVKNLEKIQIRAKGIRKKVSKRGFMGRPYTFCKSCEHKNTCALDTPCDKRDEYIANRKFLCSRAKDSRFWKNGVPKKSLILCQSSRYRWAHKRTAGECQKEKCEFYVNSRCDLALQ